MPITPFMLMHIIAIVLKKLVLQLHIKNNDNIILFVFKSCKFNIHMTPHSFVFLHFLNRFMETICVMQDP